MLVFDQLRKDDARLQVLAAGILLAMLLLLGGLWWVQIVSSKRHEASLKNQSFRSVRVPALRGHIYDRNGKVLAENRPRYDVNFYLEEILDYSRYMFTNNVVPQFREENPEYRDRTKRIPPKTINELVVEARYRAVSNITYQVTLACQQPQVLDRKRFLNHLANYPYMPFPIAQNLNATQVAIFSERFNAVRGLELEVSPIRTYPNGNSTAHILGYVQRDDRPDEDDEMTFKYYLPDFAGRTGIERIFDSELRGKAGVKSLLVNNVGYRQREEIVKPTQSGKNVTLTIDSELQLAAEKALATAQANVRGSVVVMDVRNGDLLAVVSLPAFDPNAFPNGVSHAEWTRLNDPKYSHILNRAIHGAYPPGSIFKIISGILALENGVNPKEKMYNPGYFADPQRIGRRTIKDTAPAGEYDFERAFKLSSNTYFIEHGLRAGLPKLIEVGRRFHLGERTGVVP
ncbi:MAG: penicillin-binding transpeptidase domain-containing protein, partial [Limisphaerales bacterium]